jgi:multidrug resistance protein, MATE family
VRFVVSSERSFAFIERPYTELIRLAWPIAVSFLSYATMNLVGTLFVGRLGPSALAAVGLGGVAAFTLLCFGLGAVRGVKVIISQAAGAGRAEQIQNWVGGAIAVAAALSVAVLASGPALARLLEVLADRETGKQAAEYLLIRNLGAPFVLIAAALREVRYGLSDSRTPMRAALVANLANIALDAWFILGLGWGVSGIALATVFSCALELGMLLAVQRAAGFGLRRFGAAELRRLWALGWPLGLQFLLEVGAFAILVAILARVGRVDLAAHHIALQLIHFAFLPALAIGEAASVLSGQAVGAGLDREVRRLGRRALHVAWAYTGFCALVLATCAQPLAAAFTDDPAVRALATKLLYVAAVFQLGDGANVVARGVLRGAGDVRFSAALAVLTAWVTTPPLALFLGVTLGLGALGGWLGLCAEILLGAAVLWLRLGRGGWLSAAQRSRQELRAETPAGAPALTEAA